MFRLTYKVSTLVFDPATKTFMFDDTEFGQAVDVSVLPLFGDVPTTRNAMDEFAKSLRRRGWREYNREQLDMFCDAVGCPMLVVC